jgi:hypothetical protein
MNLRLCGKEKTKLKELALDLKKSSYNEYICLMKKFGLDGPDGFRRPGLLHENVVLPLAVFCPQFITIFSLQHPLQL